MGGPLSMNWSNQTDNSIYRLLQNWEPTMRITVVLVFIFMSVFSFAAEKNQFVPFSIECSIFASNFPEIKDIHDYKGKTVTILDKNSNKGGHQLVDRIGDYEFWVVSAETLFNDRRVELFTYNAEIRNKKSGITAQARSDDNVKSVSGKAIKRADVSLLKYPKESLFETSTLKMTCMHHPGKKEEALTLSH
jgi:hypothetical protein